MNDAKYDDNGKLITRRTTPQNSLYWAFIGDCIKWHEKKKHLPKYKTKMSSFQKKYISDYFHTRFKIDVLMYEFGLISTTNLSKLQIEEYIASCVLYLAELKIDIYEV